MHCEIHSTAPKPERPRFDPKRTRNYATAAKARGAFVRLLPAVDIACEVIEQDGRFFPVAKLRPDQIWLARHLAENGYRAEAAE